MLGVSLSNLSHQFFFICIGLLGICLIVTVHELGHFLLCKIFSVRTPSFSIGFGPKLFKKKIGDTEFAISALPIGGYVEIAGSAEMGQGEQKDAHARDEHSFAVKPWYQKALIMLGGITFNLFFAYLVMIILFMIGMPSTPMLPINAKPTIASISPESPAEKAGLLPGDTITGIDDTTITEDVTGIYEILAKKPNGDVVLTIKRENNSSQIPVTLGSRQDMTGATVGVLGVTFTLADLPKLSFTESIKKGIQLTNRLIVGTAILLKNIFTKGDTKNVGGPLMIISEIKKGAQQGIKIWFLLLAIISLNLALLNLIPLPIFDGGQALIYSIEAIMRREMPIKVREFMHIVSWLLILLLLFLLLIKDVFTLIKSK